MLNYDSSCGDERLLLKAATKSEKVVGGRVRSHHHDGVQVAHRGDESCLFRRC